MLQTAHCAIVENAYTAEFAARYCPYISQITGPIDTARYIPKKKVAKEKVVLGWIGSQWTTRYLDLIRDPLTDLARRYPNLELRLIGAGDFDVPDLQIARLDWALETEVGHLQTFDIGLMPLPDDPFTRGKGGYKLLQYMALWIARRGESRRNQPRNRHPWRNRIFGRDRRRVDRIFGHIDRKQRSTPSHGDSRPRPCDRALRHSKKAAHNCWLSCSGAHTDATRFHSRCRRLVSGHTDLQSNIRAKRATP